MGTFLYFLKERTLNSFQCFDKSSGVANDNGKGSSFIISTAQLARTIEVSLASMSPMQQNRSVQNAGIISDTSDGWNYYFQRYPRLNCFIALRELFSPALHPGT